MPSSWLAFACAMLAAGLAPAFARPVAAQPVTVVTENYPPFNYRDGNAITGVSTRLVRSVLAEAGVAHAIEMVPWARAYATALAQENVLIYTMRRTSERESQFHWLVPLAKADLYLFGANDGPALAAPAELRSGAHSAVCVVADAACEILLDAGLPPERLIRVPDNSDSSEIQMVLRGRAGFYVAEPLANGYRMRQLGLAPGAVRQLARIKTGGTYYLAAGPRTDAAILHRVREAYRRLVARGEIEPQS